MKLKCMMVAMGLMVTILVGCEPAKESPQNAAYRGACQIIRAKLTGVEKIADESEAVIKQNGNEYDVALTVEGKNAFGGPTRNAVAMVIEDEGSKWKLKAFDVQPIGSALK